jgi:uncharacterized protein YbbC (DUF1343 family)
MKKLGWLLLFCWISFSGMAQVEIFDSLFHADVKVGASRIEIYSNVLKNKHVAIVGNQTSVIGKTNLVDTLVRLGLTIDKIFCPEHGFRGEVEAGGVVASSVDKTTGIPVVSLYGNNKKPTAAQLKGIDVVVFDLQDVGVRFYTYISTLHYVMEACAENHIQLVLLDRPNPNGYFIDGPVLKPDCKSFVGMHPVPIAYGMTIGEYAQMINGEKWLANGIQCELTVIPLFNYMHKIRYTLPVAPSPNLQTMNAVYLYPSLCLFEGTPLSVGRGTDFPFEVVGYPNPKFGNFTFTPKAIPGKAENPPCKNQLCHGYNLSRFSDIVLKDTNAIQLFWIIEAYKSYPDKPKFFTPFFDKLAGDKSLKEMIVAGKSEVEIKKSWKVPIQAFKQIRKKYLIYPDFE